jgi:hypothetical protein
MCLNQTLCLRNKWFARQEIYLTDSKTNRYFAEPQKQARILAAPVAVSLQY